MEPLRYGPFPYTPIRGRSKLTWPNGARLALWVAPNIEFFPLNEAIPFSIGTSPDVIGWSVRDYGARVGVFRIMDILSRYGIRGTVCLNSEVCDAYPQVLEKAMELDWEFIGHGESNARSNDGLPLEDERKSIFTTFDRIEKFTSVRPRGWLSPNIRISWNTLDVLAEAGCEYFCDFTNDDQPYLMDIGGKRMVSVPYSLEINDFPAFMAQNLTAEQFETMIKRQFDVLYREGAESGRVMAICLHPFLIGVPHRIDALDSALDYICGHDDVWLATGSEIMDHYLASDATF